MVKYFDEEWPKEEAILKQGLEWSRKSKAERTKVKRVFCIGNGESRKDFDLEKLRPHGKIYGCNAIYRDFKPDVLTCVDHGIMHEVYQSKYAIENECWFRNWTKVPTHMFNAMVGGGLSTDDIQMVVEKWDNVYENKDQKDKAKEFVFHGSNLNGIATILKKEGTKAKEHINKSFSYVSWIYENDKSNNISDVCDSKQDLGWAAGPMSGYVSIKRESPDEVYLIGHDLTSNSKKVNNLYAGTKHYVSKENAPTPHVNWVNQWFTLMDWNQKTKFYKVNPPDGRVSEKISEWGQWEVKGILKYIDYPGLAKLVGL